MIIFLHDLIWAICGFFSGYTTTKALLKQVDKQDTEEVMRSIIYGVLITLGVVCLGLISKLLLRGFI